MTYRPPFVIISEILTLVAKVAEKAAAGKYSEYPQMTRMNADKKKTCI